MLRWPRIITLMVIAAAVWGVLWLAGRGARTIPDFATSSSFGTRDAQKPALPPSAVLAIDVSRASPPPGARRQSAAPPSLAREYDTARNLKPLYDSLTGPNAPDTPAARFVRYEILRGCAGVGSEKSTAQRTWSAERRKSIADSIPDSNPEKKRRLEAYDRMAGRCAGFDGMSVTQKELDDLLDAAAQGGDPAARAVRLEREINGAVVHTGQARIDAAQFQELRDIAASHDPAAIYAVGHLLSNTYANAVVEVNGAEIDGPMAFEAWRLVACEYGLECGPESRALDSACAARGFCRAGSLADFTYYYDASPNGAQLIDQYRQVFQQAVESGDWSRVQATSRTGNPVGIYFRGWFPP